MSNREDSLEEKGNGISVWRRIEDGIVRIEKWKREQKFHREDGPAIIRRDKNGNITNEGFYLDGKSVGGLNINQERK